MRTILKLLHWCILFQDEQLFYRTKVRNLNDQLYSGTAYSIQKWCKIEKNALFTVNIYDRC